MSANKQMLCAAVACKNGPRETIALEVNFFFVSQRSSSSYILYPCHLTDAVSDKFVLVMKKQLFVKEMYHLQSHVIPSTRREVFLAFIFLYQSTKPSFKT